MATHRTVNIPFSRIIKIGIYSNQTKKATMDAIYSELCKKYPNKEVYIQNCGFFTMVTNWNPVFGLKADGVVYSNNWNMNYMAMKDNQIIFRGAGQQPTAYTDAVSGYPTLIENGKKSPSFSHCVDNTDRGRTMLGYTSNSVIFSCVGDVTGSSDFTLDEELSYMLQLKCTYAINLDGGGSSQCNYNGAKITSSRKVNNFIYMIVEPEKKTASTTATTTTTTTTSNTSSYKVGDVIKLKSGSKYSNGKNIPNWIFNSTLYCRAINNNGTVTFSTLKTGAITGTVLASCIEGSASATTATTSTSYKVKITCSVLNIRSGAGTSYQVIGTLKKGEICTITTVSGNWGKLSTGKGWISLSYTTKC